MVFKLGERVVIINSTLYNGRIGTLTKTYHSQSVVWDYYVILDRTSINSTLRPRVVGVMVDQIKKHETTDNAPETEWHVCWHETRAHQCNCDTDKNHQSSYPKD